MGPFGPLCSLALVRSTARKKQGENNHEESSSQAPLLILAAEACVKQHHVRRELHDLKTRMTSFLTVIISTKFANEGGAVAPPTPHPPPLHPSTPSVCARERQCMLVFPVGFVCAIVRALCYNVNSGLILNQIKAQELSTNGC